MLSTVQDAHYFTDAIPQAMVWLENDGAQSFTPHPLDMGLPPYVWSIEVVDIDGDGVLDVIGGSLDPDGGDIGHRLVMFQIPQ